MPSARRRTTASARRPVSSAANTAARPPSLCIRPPLTRPGSRCCHSILTKTYGVIGFRRYAAGDGAARARRRAHRGHLPARCAQGVPRRRRRSPRARPRHRRRRVRDAARPVRLRQDDGAADDRRLRAAHGRHGQLRGHDVTAAPPFDRDVHTVFQDYALFPHLSVRRNVEYPLRIAKVPRAERRERAHGGAGHRAAGGAGRPVAHGAVRRSAPAGGPGPRAGRPPVGAPARRAARRARPQAARADAGRARSRSSAPRASRSCSSPTTRTRRSPSPTGSSCSTPAASSRWGRPHEVYERPATPFVAGFVGTSNLLAGPRPPTPLLGRDGTWSVRPEKISVAGPADDPPPDTTTRDRDRRRDRLHRRHHPLRRRARRRCGALSVLLLNDGADGSPRAR